MLQEIGKKIMTTPEEEPYGARFPIPGSASYGSNGLLLRGFPPSNIQGQLDEQ